MGRAVRECIPEFPELRLRACVAPRKPTAAAASGGTSWLTPDELSKDASRSGLPDDLVILDFSLAAGTARLVEILSEWPHALVAATTGLDAATESRLTALATRAPVLRAPNLSLGIAVAQALLRALPPAARGVFQAEIVEHHHGTKKDAPITDDDTKTFALALGQLLAARNPKRVTVNMAKAERRGRVFVDWSQNDRHKTTICAYSLRIAERPTVSTPISWDEVHDTIEHGDADALTFEAPAVLERVADNVDYYAASLTAHQVLPPL